MAQSTNSVKNLQHRLFKFILIRSIDGRIERFNFLLLAHYLLNIKDIKDIPRRNVPISYFVLSRDIEKSFAL